MRTGVGGIRAWCPQIACWASRCSERRSRTIVSMSFPTREVKKMGRRFSMAMFLPGFGINVTNAVFQSIGRGVSPCQIALK